MKQKKLRAARANGSALGICSATTPRDPEYTTVPDLFQGSVDVVGILAARARVAMPTARLFAELHGFGGAR